jgi:hypothetical protein
MNQIDYESQPEHVYMFYPMQEGTQLAMFYLFRMPEVISYVLCLLAGLNKVDRTSYPNLLAEVITLISVGFNLIAVSPKCKPIYRICSYYLSCVFSVLSSMLLRDMLGSSDLFLMMNAYASTLVTVVMVQIGIILIVLRSMVRKL